MAFVAGALVEAAVSFVAGASAEAAVSFAVQKLGDFAVGRAQQFLEIADDINSIKGDFSMMKAIVKDAERRMETSEAFKEWVKQVKSAAFMIEDFMDEYVYHEQSFEAGGSSSSDQVQNFSWKIVARIEFIKNEVATISRRGQVYGPHIAQSFGLAHKQDEGESSRVIQHRPVYSSPFEEVDIVGFDEDVRKLMDWLLIEEKMPWSIMSIVGMGGSGKTALAKKVYSLAQRHFDHHFWVSVSQYSPYQSFDFLEDICKGLECGVSVSQYSPSQSSDFLEDISKGLESGSKGRQSRRARQEFRGFQDKWVDQQPRSRQYNFPKDMNAEESYYSRSKGKWSGDVTLKFRILNEKRYILFLDDINKITFWRDLEWRLPRRGRGKIIFTSREQITNFIVNGNCHVHMLNPLPFELAWDLFCRNAFQNYTPPGSCPSYLKESGAAIVSRCGGLPLAIVLMGCLMSKKDNSPKKWKDIVDHFDLELLRNPGLESLNWILQASYNNLPSQLKYCFLYCCLFPKNYRIKRKKITRLWVAQRLVEKQQGKLLEDVADDYLIQLIERSFLQPIISEFTGELKACNVHEIMHNFAISKFPEEFGILTKETSNECGQKRFMALWNYRNPWKLEFQFSTKARSLLLFDFATPFSDSLMDELLSHKFLMVLCLDGLAIKQLPINIGDLLLLRYLSLKGTQIKVLPDSLGELSNLETLDVRNTGIQSIPTNLGNLQKLRHLLLNNMKVYSTKRLVIMPTSIGSLNLLQTLSGVEVDDNFSKEVRHLVQLRKLYIRLTNLPHELLFASVAEIESLCSLKVESLDKNGSFTKLRLETPSPLPSYLEKLALGGVIMELPPWFGHLRSLRVLVLINSMLIADPLSDLAELPNLVSLKLIHAYTGDQMGCGSGGFPKLRHLHMASLIEFGEWTAIAEGAMPCIKHLSIVDCKKLRMLPEGFERLETLQSLEVIEMPEEFIVRLKQQDSSKIQYIPRKTFLQRTDDNY